MVRSLTEDCTAVTPSDTVEFSKPGIIFVGTAGDVKFKTLAGNTRTIKCPSGYEIKCIARQVFDTDTTATDMILYHE